MYLKIQFNLIFKHGKIWAEIKRYEWRKERNTATKMISDIVCSA